MIDELSIALEVFNMRYPYISYEEDGDYVEVICRNYGVKAEVGRLDPNDLLEHLTKTLHENIVRDYAESNLGKEENERDKSQ